MYAGKAGGTSHFSRGGGVKKLCLPDNPDYLAGTSGIARRYAFIHGAEYQFDNGPNTNVFQHNIPFAACVCVCVCV